jgi:hypothetical protein
MPNLIVQTAQGVPDGSGVIVLNESVPDSQLGKLCLVIALEEESAVILEHGGLDQTDAWKRGLSTFHLVVKVARSRYSPATRARPDEDSLISSCAQSLRRGISREAPSSPRNLTLLCFASR